MLGILNGGTEAGWAKRTFLADHTLQQIAEGCGYLEA